MEPPLLDLQSEKPLYLQLAEVVKSRIAEKEWELGMMIPSENQLAKDFNISVGTVKNALNALVTDGVLFRRQGKGTFVASPDFSKSFSRFFRYDWRREDRTEIPGSKILAINQMPASPQITEKLQLDPAEEVYWLKRVRTIQNKPFVLEDIYISARRFKGIDSLSLDQRLLYPIYNDQFSTPVIWAEEYLQPEAANIEVAEILGIQFRDPVMRIERFAYTYGEVPVEWRCSTGRGDLFRYHIVVR